MICFTSLTSNVVAGLQNGHVHVLTRSLQSKATNVSLSLVMYFKKQTFLFFQEITWYYFMSIKYICPTKHGEFSRGRVVWHSSKMLQFTVIGNNSCSKFLNQFPTTGRSGVDPGEVKWVNFHPPFSEPPSFFFFFLSLKCCSIIFDFSDFSDWGGENSPPISKSWIRAWRCHVPLSSRDIKLQ